jgi:tryptophanyl-tRNA synthetase
MSQKILLTGDRPTGPLHLGHYVGSLMNRVKWQNDYQCYILIADLQALTDYFDRPEHVKENVFEVMRDYLAVGLNPDVVTIFQQSQIPALAELSMFYMNLVSVSRLERNPTVKAEIQQKGFSDAVPAGFFCYPISQAADITAFQGQVIPVGEDQIPMIELCNEIVRRFNRIYQTDCLKEAEAFLGKNPRLVGIDGQAKASKSLANAIFLKDSTEVLKEKVMQMYTDPQHIKISDPGRIEGNVVFAYLEAFYQNVEHLNELKAHYQKGGLGDITLKNLLFDILEKFLEPIRARRQSFKDSDLKEILFQGSRAANLKANHTLHQVKEAMFLL